MQNELTATELSNEGGRLERMGDLTGALEKYRAAVKLFPASVPRRANYAALLLRLGHWADGLNELHDVLEIDPFNEKIRAAMQVALQQAPPGSVPNWAREAPAPK